jgi:hypothetical protein
MLVNMTDKCSEFYPMMKIKSIGYGAGQKNFEGFSNVLKIIHGESANNLESDSVVILETNVDDISGEVLVYAVDKIMANGARDVSIIPATTKKGRPSHIISVICKPDTANKLLDLLVSETGTLGVRVRTSERFIVPRKILTTKIRLRGKSFTVQYKVAKINSNTKRFKIEYDDIREIASKLSLPFKQTEELIKSEIKKQL